MAQVPWHRSTQRQFTRIDDTLPVTQRRFYYGFSSPVVRLVSFIRLRTHSIKYTRKSVPWSRLRRQFHGVRYAASAAQRQLRNTSYIVAICIVSVTQLPLHGVKYTV